MLRLFLIRHGAVPANAEKKYIGRTDESLSEPGRQQLRSLWNQEILPQADAVFVSPMRRCRETAEILYPGREQIVIPALREIDFGDFEGKNAAELLADPASGYQEWIDSGGRMAFPHGEARADFIVRSRRGFAEMMKMCTEQDSSDRVFCAAAVVHGGTIMAILSGLCGGDYYDYMCRNGEGYQVDVQRKGRHCGEADSGLKRIPADLSASGEKR